MEVAGSLFTSLVLACVITTGGLAVHLTQNFGTLALQQDIKQQVSGSKLVGPYGNALSALSAITIGLAGLYILFFTYGVYVHRHDKTVKVQRVYWSVMILAVILGLVSASVNLHLTSDYTTLLEKHDLIFDPNPPIANENYKLQGSYGIATTSLASISLGVSGIAFLWLMVLWSIHWKSHWREDHW